MAEDVRAEIVASVLEVVVSKGDRIGAGDTLVFPVIQTCEKGESQWTEVQSADTPGEKLSRPAATLRLTPVEPMPAGHQH